MPDYTKLRQMVSHRVTFEFDTGARVTGYVAACKPPTGQVQVVNLVRADLCDSTGRVLEHHEAYSFVPNALVGVRVTEGPSGREA
ncbi:MAG: hypothetical protein EXR73_12270 [Myxococcales bacterium]|nr:hypothetical protein [Myxococcales bacterium]